MTDLPILISGGGIGGTAAALALARQGRAVRLLEQSRGFGEIGAGIQLGPNVFKMFERLNLTETIDETAVRPDALVMRDALDGEIVTRVPLNDDGFRAHFPYPYAVTYRPDLHNALLEACRRESLVELVTSAKVTGFDEIDAAVRVTLEDGAQVEGVGLIGADGLWSKVRETLLGDGTPRVSGHIAYRAVLPVDEMPAHLRWNEVVLWAGPNTHLVQYPLRRGEIFNLVAVFHSDRYEEGWDVFGDSEELFERFSGEHPHVLELLGKIESWRMWVLCDREPVREWSRGNATLLGDAAHPMLQYLAQGACMAIEDAVCLAHQTSKHGDDLAAAFRAYQDQRYLRTGRLQLTARFYGDVYHAAGVTRELRNMTLAPRTPEQAYQGMNWLYNGVGENGEQILKAAAAIGFDLMVSLSNHEAPPEQTRRVQMAMHEDPSETPERLAYYDRIRGDNLAPLWQVFNTLITKEPASDCQPHLWRYAMLRERILEAGNLISAKEAERRVLILENPGFSGQARITTSLFSGLQLVLPGEVAPAHRHSQSALRFIMEGAGGQTAVDGERTIMAEGDFVITPPWSWHDHGNESDAPMIWLDGLDIPLVRFFDTSFAEGYPADEQPVTTPDGDSEARYGANMLPVDYRSASPVSPLFAYPYARSREALETMRRRDEWDPCHGLKMRYTNPNNGGHAMPTISAFLQLLPKGFKTRRYRATDATVFVCVEGGGKTRIGRKTLEWGRRDIFVVPSWQPVVHEAASDAVLFSFSDRPVQEKLALWREKRG